MRYINTHHAFTRTIAHKCSRVVSIECDEYATVWRFTARIIGWALPCASDWAYKKKEYKNYDAALQAFLSDLAIHTNY